MDKVCANCSASVATIMCDACKSFLCKQCDTEIHKNKIFSTHKRKKATGQAITFPTTTCNKHNEPILAVCKECKEACCLFCITEFHVGHAILQYAIHLEACKERQEGIQKYFEMHTNLATETSSTVKDEIKALEDNRKLTMDQINEDFQTLSQLFEKRRDALIKEVTEKADDIKGRIEAEISKINENCIKAESVNSEIEATNTENDDAMLFSKCVNMEKVIQDIGTSVATIINVSWNDSINFDYSGVGDKEINDKINPLHLEVTTKYNSEPKPLKVSSHTDKSGKRVFELNGTTIKITWDLVPKCINTLVQRTKCVEYVLECKVAEKSSKKASEPHDDNGWPSNCCTSDGSTPPTIVYSGKDTSATYAEIEKGKIVVFRVRALLQYHEHKQVLWTSNFLTVYGNSLFNFEWKPCPSDIRSSAKYELDKENSSIATQVNGSKSCSNGCTIVGSEPLPLGVVIKWRIKYINGESNGCCGGVGVAPISIDQSEDRNAFKCGWYYNPFASVLRSGPPHKYSDEEYGPYTNERGSTIDTGDEIGVIMDMENGTLSFVIKGVDYGVAFKDIPLDEPLVPCVITGHIEDSVEIISDDI